jgi:hypothetical protein
MFTSIKRVSGSQETIIEIKSALRKTMNGRSVTKEWG